MHLVVCAVAKELEWFTPPSGVEVLVCGVGPVEAAARVAQALSTRRYATVINAGIAGAFPGIARVGERVVVAHERLELDLETGVPIALPAGERIADRTSSDASLVAALVEAGLPSVRGVTVMHVTATAATAARLAALGAEVESMEGFAVLRAAELAGIPAVEVRGISNLVGDRTNGQWNFGAGIAGLQHAMHVLLPLLGALS
ncbi:MAG: futalosine hydrolase [Vulcanimicrobiaceae bacterium]